MPAQVQPVSPPGRPGSAPPTHRFSHRKIATAYDRSLKRLRVLRRFLGLRRAAAGVSGDGRTVDRARARHRVWDDAPVEFVHLVLPTRLKDRLAPTTLGKPAPALRHRRPCS
jgi:hypothetical protein